MGIYDIYGDIEAQIKAGDCQMKRYLVNDKCDLADGVYAAYEGVIVIKHGVLIAEFPVLKDKWGDTLDLGKILENQNPISLALLNKKYNPGEVLQFRYCKDCAVPQGCSCDGCDAQCPLDCEKNAGTPECLERAGCWMGPGYFNP